MLCVLLGHAFPQHCQSMNGAILSCLEEEVGKEAYLDRALPVRESGLIDPRPGRIAFGRYHWPRARRCPGGRWTVKEVTSRLMLPRKSGANRPSWAFSHSADNALGALNPDKLEVFQLPWTVCALLLL